MQVSYRSLLQLSDQAKLNHQNQQQLKLAEACRDFEGLFIQKILQEMRKGLNNSSSSNQNQQNFFTDMLYQRYATELANQSSFGLGELLFSQAQDLAQAVNQYQKNSPANDSSNQTIQINA